MRKIVTLLAVIGLLVAAVSAFAATRTVAWKSSSTTTVKIHPGQTITWVWADSAPHNIKGPGVSSRVVNKRGYRITHKFAKRGTFRYICQVHPNMGTVVKVG